MMYCHRYGFLVGVLQGYLIIQSVRKFVWFAELSWPYKQTPFIELNAYIVLTGKFFLFISIITTKLIPFLPTHLIITVSHNHKHL